MNDFQEFIAGTGDLTSNWPNEHLRTRVPKDRRTKEFYAIDCDGETLMKAAIMPQKELRKLLNLIRAGNPDCKVEARYVCFTENDLRLEDAKTRKQLWETIKYK